LFYKIVQLNNTQRFDPQRYFKIIQYRYRQNSTLDFYACRDGEAEEDAISWDSLGTEDEERPSTEQVVEPQGTP
jgi:hypothetical protein